MQYLTNTDQLKKLLEFYRWPQYLSWCSLFPFCIGEHSFDPMGEKIGVMSTLTPRAFFQSAIKLILSITLSNLNFTLINKSSELIVVFSLGIEKFSEIEKLQWNLA